MSTKLNNVVAAEAVGDEKFNHIDFMFAPNIKELLNDRIMEVIRNVLGDRI